VVQWLIPEGAEVDAGAEVVDIETEKLASAVEAPVDGVLRRQVAGEGDLVPVAGLLGVIADGDVTDEQIDALVEEFLVTFVPPETESSEPGYQRVDIGGRSLRFLERGDGGEPVLLLHGFGGDLNNWLFNHEALAASRSVYAIDLPGHGESSKDVGDGTIASLAEAVEGFMVARGLSTAHLIGHSLGGGVALGLALANPGRVSSISLIASAGLGLEIDTEFVDGFVGAQRRREILPHLEKLFADPSRVTRQLVDDVLKFKRLDGVDDALQTVAGKLIVEGRQALVLRDHIVEVSVPVMVIWGAEDRIIPASQAEGFGDAARVAIIEDAGHMVQMEAASEVNRLIEEFLG
jgi:pyruvate dehydrogenase E2 component (dihydrolipoamide acetyltransferase)